MSAFTRPATLLFVLLLTCTSQADELPAPTGPVILTVSGKIAHSNAEGLAKLDMAMLDSLPQHHITTSTPWFDSPRRFSGPLLEDLAGLVGGTGREVLATALNDYSITLPARDFVTYEVVMATRIDGETISVREKGPIFVIYPFDQYPELVSEAYYQRCIWQLHRLEFK